MARGFMTSGYVVSIGLLTVLAIGCSGGGTTYYTGGGTRCDRNVNQLPPPSESQLKSGAFHKFEVEQGSPDLPAGTAVDNYTYVGMDAFFWDKKKDFYIRISENMKPVVPAQQARDQQPISAQRPGDPLPPPRRTVISQTPAQGSTGVVCARGVDPATVEKLRDIREIVTRLDFRSGRKFYGKKIGYKYQDGLKTDIENEERLLGDNLSLEQFFLDQGLTLTGVYAEKVPVNGKEQKFRIVASRTNKIDGETQIIIHLKKEIPPAP